MTLVADGVVGDHRFDYLTADGLDLGRRPAQIDRHRGRHRGAGNIDVGGQPAASTCSWSTPAGRRVDVSRIVGSTGPNRFLPTSPTGANG